METEKGLVKTSEVRLPKFVEQAYDSIEGMKQFANMLLESKLVPDSYYEKGADNKPDYTKGKTSAVVIVLLQAQQLAVPPMTGLQHIVPVNGLLSIKGDLAKTMIFASGKLRKDSWKETVTGTIEEENMVVSITATRDDNGATLTRSFSVDKAKRMGLWVTSAMANSTDGWKWKKSAWFKTPDRMLNYRCLGNLARDLFSDVLLNMYTTEEAVDINNDTTEVVETESGAKITIPDKEHAKARSGKMTDRVADKIPDNKFGEVKKDNIPDAEVINSTTELIQAEIRDNLKEVSEEIGKEKSPFIATKESVEYMNGIKVIRDAQTNEITNMDEINDKDEEQAPAHTGKYSLKQLEDMDTKILLQMINEDTDMIEASSIIGGKNTNKKLREIVFAHQENKLAEYVAPYIKEEPPAQTLGENLNPNVAAFENEKRDISKENDDFLNAPMKKSDAVPAGNKYGIVVSDAIPRDFSEIKQIFNRMMGVTPQITTPVYMALAEKLGLLKTYPDKEGFLKYATKEEIDLLLNSN